MCNDVDADVAQASPPKEGVHRVTSPVLSLVVVRCLFFALLSILIESIRLKQCDASPILLSRPSGVSFSSAKEKMITSSSISDISPSVDVSESKERVKGTGIPLSFSILPPVPPFLMESN